MLQVRQSGGGGTADIPLVGPGPARRSTPGPTTRLASLNPSVASQSYAKRRRSMLYPWMKLGEVVTDDRSLVQSMPTLSVTEEISAGTTVALLSTLPIFGPWMAAGVSIPASLLARKEQEVWLLQLAEAVDRLINERMLPLDEVVTDPQFAAAVARTTRLSLETSRAGKRRLLANAACNSGSWSSSSEPLKSHFMKIVDKYEPEHFFVLKACDDPGSFLEKFGGVVGDAAFHRIFESVVYQGLDEWMAMGDKLLDELSSDGLVDSGYGMGFTLFDDGSRKFTTSLGSKLLQFCSGLDIDIGS